MKIVVLCATKRGFRFLESLYQLTPNADISVFSFKEEEWEPKFLDDIKNLAIQHKSNFYETKNVNSPRWKDFWNNNPIDLMLVVSWRYLIPSGIYTLPQKGTYVFHDSLLPKYRGFSPTVWAMINGEEKTGVTLFEIADEVDSGAIIDQEEVQIQPDDDIAVVMERVTQGYLKLLKNNISALLNGTAIKKPQNRNEATFTCKRIPEDNRINWCGSTQNIYNLIRASAYPYPGAFTHLHGQRMRVWSSKIMTNKLYVGKIPGRVVEILPGIGAIVLTGDGAILLEKVQLDDSEVVSADTLLNSITITLD